MKSLTVSTLLFVFLFNQIAGAAGICQELFPEIKAAKIETEAAPKKTLDVKFKTPVATDSDRTQMFKVNDEGINSHLKLEEMALSKDPDQAVLELMQLLADGPTYALEDKNVLLKNKMSLGIRLKNGFTFVVNYESKSTERSWFVVEDKIILLSPTNKEIKVTDGIIHPTQLKLAKTDFDMPEYFDKDNQVVLKIPLAIEPEVITKLAEFTPLFEHMSKEKLRKLLAIKSPFKRKALFQLERLKSIFKKQALKEPSKVIFQVATTVLVTFGVNHALTTSATEAFRELNAKPAAVVDVATMTSSFTAGELLAKAQYAALRKEIQEKAMTESRSAHAEKAKDLIAGGGTSFTLNAKTFIFEQEDSLNGSMHTYIVFAEQKTVKNQPAFQYYATEINAAKYAPMIKAIKAHQQIN